MIITLDVGLRACALYLILLELRIILYYLITNKCILAL
jgi:hypothetical protein